MSTTKPQADYSRKIAVMRGGKSVDVPLSEIDIPDLWHVARTAAHALDKLEAVQRALDLDVPDEEQLATIRALMGGSIEGSATSDGKRASDAILAVWHAAHDLKRNLAGDANPNGA